MSNTFTKSDVTFQADEENNSETTRTNVTRNRIKPKQFKTFISISVIRINKQQ